jgi:hypothetical protein
MAQVHASIIDSDGRIWAAGAPEVRALLGEVGHTGVGIASQLRPEDAVVAVLGYVRLDQHDHGLEISLDPRRVAGAATAALLYEVARRRPRRVVLGQLNEERPGSSQLAGISHGVGPDSPAPLRRSWSMSMLGDHRQALECLIRLLEPARARGEERFVRRAVDVGTLPSGHPLDALLTAWRDAAGTFDRERLGPLLSGVLADRFTFARVGSNGERVQLSEVGRGYDPVVVRSFERGRGLRLEDQIDQAYGAWLAQSYRAVAVELCAEVGDGVNR